MFVASRLKFGELRDGEIAVAAHGWKMTERCVTGRSRHSLLLQRLSCKGVVLRIKTETAAAVIAVRTRVYIPAGNEIVKSLSLEILRIMVTIAYTSSLLCASCIETAHPYALHRSGIAGSPAVRCVTACGARCEGVHGEGEQQVDREMTHEWAGPLHDLAWTGATHSPFT
ncbi:hypothetical protein GWK47_026614 [Chionoecetes opilio]|uniref:Uncharacterized protein n=1 Tax=Chionoecetes opilio TaxID=41210 RepID=A0A8J8WMN6_CHIOP|nr:hypothetical protein GWK47_026614 [Chionoecetes opilio]